MNDKQKQSFQESCNEVTMRCSAAVLMLASEVIVRPFPAASRAECGDLDMTAAVFEHIHIHDALIMPSKTSAVQYLAEDFVVVYKCGEVL